MKAIILNSGIGKRMRPFTYRNPKCMAKLNGDTILGHEIGNLLEYGVNNIIITTGPFEDKVKDFVKRNFPNLNVRYIKNHDYKSTNYIYSLWLTKDFIDDNIILLHGDMVFEKELLGRLLEPEHENCVLVNNKIKLPKKDFKAQISDNLVKKIGVDVFGKNAFFLAPVYKFSKHDFQSWLGEIGKFVSDKNLNVYAEDAFNNISNKIKLYPAYFGNELCMEVDNFDDLEIAKQFFKRSH